MQMFAFGILYPVGMVLGVRSPFSPCCFYVGASDED